MENNVLNFIDNNIQEKYDGKVLVLINSFQGSPNHDAAINIHNRLKSMPNEFYTVITGHCSGISFIPFLAAKKENRFALSKTSLVLDYQLPPSSSFITEYNLDSYYRKFEKELISKETLISNTILKKIFDDIEKHRINCTFFESYDIAKVIQNFSELPIPLSKCEIVSDEKV